MNEDRGPRRGKHRYLIDGQSFEVEVRTRSASEADVIVNGQRFHVERAASADESAATPHAGASVRARRAAPSVAGELRAPMAGLVLRVDVTPGQTLAAGDQVLVLDAMKMENAIRAPHAGKLRELVVRAGESVPTGALLARIDEA